MTNKMLNNSSLLEYHAQDERQEEKVTLFSGGKDSLVVGHYTNTKKAVYCKTGVGLNFDYVLETCNKLGWELEVIFPKVGEAFEDFVRKFGFPHVSMHNAVMGYLKWHPLRSWNRGLEIKPLLLSGRRKKESKRRMRMKSNTEYTETEGMRFHAPIYQWTTKQVWDYIKNNKLEVSPIYETMHISGDCFCGAFAQKGESQLLYTFHKDLALRMKELEDVVKQDIIDLDVRIKAMPLSKRRVYLGKVYKSKKWQEYQNLVSLKRTLEQNCKWGNNTSMTGSFQQSKLTDLICAECVIRN